MPQVPVYGDRQVRTEALRPVAQQTPDVSSGAVALARGLGVVAEVADQIDLRDAQAKANEIDTQLTRAWNDWENANRGKYTNQAAEGYTKAVDEWWREAAKTYGAGLNARSQAMVGNTLARRQTIALEQAGKYEFGEKEKYADSTTAASINTATVNALKTGDYAGEAQRIRDLIAEQGARKNWSKEQRDAELNARMGGFNTTVIAQLAEKDAVAAQKYLNGAIERGEIRPDQQPRLEAVIKGEADNQFATQEAARLAAMPLKEQLAEASKITDPQRREKTLTQIRNNYALVKQAEQEAESRASDQAWQLFAQGKKIPESVLAGMDGRNRVQLQEAQRVRAERAVAGTPVKTDWATYIDVRERLAAGEKVDLRTLTEKIGPAQMEQLIDIQTSASKGGGKQDSMLTDEGRINAALTGLGIDKKKDPKTAAALTNEIDRRVRAASAAKGGKDLSADEKQSIVDRVVTDKVYVDEFGRDPEKPLALVPPEELAKAYVRVDGKNVPVSSVPATDRRQIIQALQATGQIVTEQAVVEMYLAGKKKPAAASPAPLVNYPQTPPPEPVTLPARSPAPAAPATPPSIYASPEEWARYRAQQSSQRP